MAATSDPPEESVALFCDITGLLRDEAITRLKVTRLRLHIPSGEASRDTDRRTSAYLGE